MDPNGKKVNEELKQTVIEEVLFNINPGLAIKYIGDRGRHKL